MITRRRLITFGLLIILLSVITSTFVLSGVLVKARTQTPPASVQVQGHSASSCGGAKTGLGWLHVANGSIVDASACPINLKGFNWAGTGFGNALGSPNQQRVTSDITWFSQNFHMNLWRVFLNAVWWNTNVSVPDAGAGMHYQAWIQQLVKMMESNGNYVLLTKGEQFHTPPCGGSITYCAPQNQATIDIKKDPNKYRQEATTGQYISDAVQMWTSVAHLYANDSAVLYDSWNEMHGITPQLWQQNTNTLIDTIQKQNPRAIVLFGGPNWENGINPLVKGQVPAFTQSNLVYDFHVYNGFKGTYQGQSCQSPANALYINWPTNANSEVGYARQHGAASFSEWGGCNDVEPYNTNITSFARTNHVLLAYYEKDMVYSLSGNGNTYQLNSNGTKARTDYASL